MKLGLAGKFDKSPRITRRVILHSALVAGATAGVVAAKELSPRAALRKVMLADFGGGPQIADNSAALRAALVAIADAGGGAIMLAPGTHRFMSASLGRGGILLPSNIALCGAGRDKTILAITGDQVCNFLVATNNGGITIENLTIIGNNVAMTGATIYGSGSGIRWLLDSQATRSVSQLTLRGLHIENFRGPYWIDIENSSHADRALEMRDISIADISFRSRPGNCVGVDDIRLNAAVICLAGQSGMIRNVQVSDLAGDASYIKTGIILYHAIVDAVLDRVTVARAGREGIGDDAGAYAIQLYDNASHMSRITVSNAVLSSPRSTGIYVVGGFGVRIVNAEISGQSDRRDATLPKGAIALNGTRNFQIQGGVLRSNWRDIEIVAPVEGDGTAPCLIAGSISGIRSDGSESGLVVRHARGHVAQGITINDCQWRTRSRTVLIDNVQDVPAAPSKFGYVRDVVFQNCKFEAGAGARAMEILGAVGAPTGGYVVEGCTLSGTNPLFARDVEGALRVANCEVRDFGTMAGMAAASLLNCARLDLRDATFVSPGQGGIGIDLGGSMGGVRGLRFVKATHVLPTGRSPRQLGRARPAFACEAGQSIQNLERAGGEPALWKCGGGSRWSDG